MSIFSATYRDGENIMQAIISLRTDYGRQLLFFLLSGIIGIFILLTDSKFFTATANLWYAFGIFLMLLVFPFHSHIKGTDSIIRFGGSFQIQPADICKMFVNLALAKYLSRVDTNFSRLRSQLIAAAIALFPALLSIMQKELGLALVYFSFFLVMFREGLPPSVLIIGFSLATLVVATLLLEPNTLALILTAVALIAIYFLRKQIKRKRSILFLVISIWFICVGIQRFVVPFAFDHMFQPYQVKRIYDAIGKEYVPKDELTAIQIEQKSGGKKNDHAYNVKQSMIAIGSGGVIGKGLLKGTQTRYAFVPE
jgi:rod shape determining protein RodA